MLISARGDFSNQSIFALFTLFFTDYLPTCQNCRHLSGSPVSGWALFSGGKGGKERRDVTKAGGQGDLQWDPTQLICMWLFSGPRAEHANWRGLPWRHLLSESWMSLLAEMNSALTWKHFLIYQLGNPHEASGVLFAFKYLCSEIHAWRYSKAR